MQVLQIIGILVIFLGITALMIMRKLPTILALPLMAILLVLVGGAPLYDANNEFDVLNTVIKDGSIRLAGNIMSLFFGSWFGQVLLKTGITKSIIRKAAELAGDRPLPIALIFYIVASIIFSGSSGLGMVILVGTIIIPIMISAGVSPGLASIVALLANATGVIFNANNFNVYVGILNQELEVVARTAWVAGVPMILVSFVMIFMFSKKTKAKAWAMPSGAVDMVDDKKNVRPIALIAPLLPVVLIYACTMFKINIDVTAAIMVGIVLTMILATPKRPVQILSSAFVEGIQEAAGAAGLMIGIGMLLKAVANPSPVAPLLEPIFKFIVPTNPLLYVVLFIVLAPLAIYRGPLNMYGLGAGIASLFISGGLNPMATMLAFRVNSNLQAVCDPTNTHNVWVCDFTKTDVNDILKKTMLWMLAASLVGLIAATFIAF